ncbi:MAG: WXG100 family type VII secretion target [Oscillospiraceae bacterium]|nr:WXG100 family type VII secretion target [Oscillospiraceae bacterium]
MSSSGSGSDVGHLDTVNFEDTIASYAKHRSELSRIVSDVSATVQELTDVWMGVGSEAFEVDARQVQLNLQDIEEIMDEIGNALANAQKAYTAADEEITAAFRDI